MEHNFRCEFVWSILKGRHRVVQRLAYRGTHPANIFLPVPSLFGSDSNNVRRYDWIQNVLFSFKWCFYRLQLIINVTVKISSPPPGLPLLFLDPLWTCRRPSMFFALHSSFRLQLCNLSCTEPTFASAFLYSTKSVLFSFNHAPKNFTCNSKCPLRF